MKFSFYRVHRTRAYWLVIGLLVAANVWTAIRYRAALGDDLEHWASMGFPFPFYVGGGSGSVHGFLVTGMLLDIVIAWTLALIAARIALTRQRGQEQAHKDASGSAGGQQQASNVNAGIETQETADH